MLSTNDHPDVLLSVSALTNFLPSENLTQPQVKAALDLRGRLLKDADPHTNLVGRHREVFDEVEANLRVISSVATSTRPCTDL